MKYILALDQGTTSSRCLIFDEQLNIAGKAQKEFKQIYPQEGWVEHDPYDLLNSQILAVKEALDSAKLSAGDMAALGIANQRETVIVWDRETGMPFSNAIVWQCRRTAGVCEQLQHAGYGPLFAQKTGLRIDPYFSATKIKWVLDHVPDAKKAAESGRACFGTVDSWLIFNLTKGRRHVTDVSNAARTMLYNIHTLSWDEDLLSLMNIPRSMLPEVVNTAGAIGYTDPSLFDAEIPITAAAGDQQAALFGQGCFDAGMFKTTYGTGCFMLLNTGDAPCTAQNGLLSTIAWKIGEKITYAAEGSVFIAGAAIQWLRDELGLIATSEQSETEAVKVPNTGGVYLVPAFSGLGAPYWVPEARGLITGITRGTNRYHIIRAALESIAYQADDIIKAMQQQSGQPIRSLAVDGGASRNNFLMQFQSDISNLEIVRPACTETTALGAALMAGLAAGVFSSYEEIRSMLKTERIFKPVITDQERKLLKAGWTWAVKQCQEDR